MLRSMFAGVSGLRSMQTMMDVIGNNIANVNTTGYKAGSVVFQDLLSQTIRGAATPTATTGGTNSAQIGLGVRLAGVSTNFAQGAVQLTGRATDVSIEGDGFFIVNMAGQQMYTRSGSFSFDAAGRLVTSDGAIVQGWPADNAGTINPNSPVENLVMPLGQIINPNTTTSVAVNGNLNSTMPTTAPDNLLVSSITVYDLQGTPVNVTMTFEHTAANDWTLTATMPDLTSPGDTVEVGTVDLTWDPATQDWDPAPDLTLAPTAATGDWPASAEIAVDFGVPGSPEYLTAFAGPSSAAITGQDGTPAGTLQSFSIAPDGTVVGVFSNGQSQAVGRIALANFTNPGGLDKAGGSLYRAGANSGLARVGQAGQNGLGNLNGFSLEMSNVDLAQEFTNLIVAQRGFQANSRVITASDEVLSDLVNLKR